MTARAGGVRPFEPPPAARESLQGHYAGFASRFAAFVGGDAGCGTQVMANANRAGEGRDG
jgi:hypothetical protein